jgi:hypothetical protein
MKPQRDSRRKECLVSAVRGSVPIRGQSSDIDFGARWNLHLPSTTIKKSLIGGRDRTFLPQTPRRT